MGRGRILAVLSAALMAGACAEDDSPEPMAIDAGAAPAPEEGVALAIVYDTSGSMREAPEGGGGAGRKWEIANRAVESIVDRVEAWRKAAPAGTPRRVEAGLVTFREGQGVPMGPFDPDAFRGWVRGFRSPDGATPLGRAVAKAGAQVLRSPMMMKHVLVVTDGRNTEGPGPAEAMDALSRAAVAAGAGISVHFVAFDVDAKVFDDVKARGATVAGASDAKQLDARLKAILEEEILLEAGGKGPSGPGK